MRLHTGKPGELVKLQTGGRGLVTTDDQGEEVRASTGGAISGIAPAPRWTFIEGGDLERAAGAKLGCSLQLNDNDGSGRAALSSWGDGLHPTWAPTHLDALTLVE